MYIYIYIYTKPQFLHQREHGVLPLGGADGECCTGNKIAKAVLSDAVHRFY